MRKPSRNRLYGIIILFILCSVAVYTILFFLSDRISFFYTSSEIAHIRTDRLVRVGGIVKVGSIVKEPNSQVQFIITDNKQDIVVSYRGNLPRLFAESMYVIARGKYDGTILKSDTMLIKHGEYYKPKR